MEEQNMYFTTYQPSIFENNDTKDFEENYMGLHGSCTFLKKWIKQQV